MFQRSFIILLLSSTNIFSALPAREIRDIERSFELPPGFQIQLVAAEPDIINPMTMCVAGDHAIYVTEAHSYRWGAKGSPFQPPQNPIKRFELGKNGRVARTIVAAEGFPNPVMGIDVDGPRLYATCVNELFVMEIAPDGRLNNRRLLIKDAAEPWNPFGMYRVRVGPDGKLWLAIADHPSTQPVTLTGSDGRTIRLSGQSGGLVRCNADGSELEIIAHGFRAPFAFDYDPWGHVWQISNGENSPNIYAHIIPGLDYGYASRNASYSWLAGRELLSPPVHDLGPGANTAALHYYSSGLPDRFWGNVFIANWGSHGRNSSNRNIRRFVREKNGRSLSGGADDELVEAETFLKSTDPLFRPTQMTVAPDGGIYLLDWHGQDDENDTTGRILKIAFAGVKPLVTKRIPTAEEVAKFSPRALLRALGDRNQFVRESAQRVLAEGGTNQLPELGRIAEKGGALAAAGAVCVLSRMNSKRSVESLQRGLKNSDARVRGHVLRQLRQAATGTLGDENLGIIHHSTNEFRTAVERSPSQSDLARIAAPLLNDAEAEVRIEAALAQDSSDAVVGGLQRALEITTERRLLYQIGMELARRDSAEVIQQLATSKNENWKHAAMIALDVARYEKTILAKKIQERAPQLLEETPPADFAAKLEWLRQNKPKLLAAEFDRIESGQAHLADSEKIAALNLMEAVPLEKLPLEFLLASLRSGSGAVQQQSLRVVRQRGNNDVKFLEPVLQIAQTGNSFDLRIEAIFTLGGLNAALTPTHWLALLSSPRREIAAAALRSLRQLELPNELLTALIKAAPEIAARDTEIAEEMALTLRAAGVHDEQCAGLTLTPKERPQPEFARAVISRLPKASAKLGRMVFTSTRIGCTKCHATRAEELSLGPNLAKIGSSSKSDYLLESILAPSAVIKTGYDAETIETTDGETYSGRTVSQGKLLIVKTASNDEISIPLERVRNRTPSRLSLMPQGLDSAMSEGEVADLLAYLLSLK